MGVGNFAGGGGDFKGTFTVGATGTFTGTEGELFAVGGGDFKGTWLIGAIGTSAGMSRSLPTMASSSGPFFMSGGGCNNRGGISSAPAPLVLPESSSVELEALEVPNRSVA